MSHLDIFTDLEFEKADEFVRWYESKKIADSEAEVVFFTEDGVKRGFKRRLLEAAAVEHLRRALATIKKRNWRRIMTRRMFVTLMTADIVESDVLSEAEMLDIGAFIKHKQEHVNGPALKQSPFEYLRKAMNTIRKLEQDLFDSEYGRSFDD